MAHQHVRINIQLGPELKEAIAELSRQRGESVSEFFRRSAEERLHRLQKEEEERLLAKGYQVMADELSGDAREWGNVDLEGWE